MNQVSLILTAIMFLCLTVFLTPRIFALNRGKILQTIALWLALFVGFALIYKNFGPDGPHPLFSLPDAMTPQPAKAPANDQNRG